MTGKSTKGNKATWDEIESVPASTKKPEVATVEGKVEDGQVPFGGIGMVQNIIREYREHFAKEAPKKRGKAESPEGTRYNYYLSEDIMAHVNEFIEKKGCYLDMYTRATENGISVMYYVLEHLETGQVKTVSMSLGSPSSLADLGARVTYAPKYLLAAMFGISIATDTDGFRNGEVTDEPNETDKPAAAEKVDADAEAKDDGVDVDASSDADTDGGDSPSDSSTDTKPEQVADQPASVEEAKTTERSASFNAASNFIMKASTPALLDQAVVKLANSTKLSAEEKDELTAMIDAKREGINGDKKE